MNNQERVRVQVTTIEQTGLVCFKQNWPSAKRMIRLNRKQIVWPPK